MPLADFCAGEATPTPTNLDNRSWELSLVPDTLAALLRWENVRNDPAFAPLQRAGAGTICIPVAWLRGLPAIALLYLSPADLVHELRHLAAKGALRMDAAGTTIYVDGKPERRTVILRNPQADGDFYCGYLSQQCPILIQSPKDFLLAAELVCTSLSRDLFLTFKDAKAAADVAQWLRERRDPISGHPFQVAIKDERACCAPEY